jgi:plasmid stabilization system protein ParE
MGGPAVEASGLSVPRPVVFRPQAEHEALEARRWYESRRAGLGTEFGESLAALLTRVASNPLSFPTIHGEARRAVLARFPYAIYFRFADETVVVLSVHGRRDPNRWRGRM